MVEHFDETYALRIAGPLSTVGISSVVMDSHNVITHVPRGNFMEIGDVIQDLGWDN